MTEEAYPSSAARPGREASGMAVGFILFAAIMMLMVGACTVPGPWPHGPPTASASWRLAGSPGIVRSGPATLPDETEPAASRLLELLRSAA